MYDGADIETEVFLTLDESLKPEGTQKQIEILREMLCSVCKGTKEQPGSKSNACYSCKGLGIKKDPLFHKESKCNTCQGHGKLV